jgi:hypothetical protein
MQLPIYCAKHASVDHQHTPSTPLLVFGTQQRHHVGVQFTISKAGSTHVANGSTGSKLGQSWVNSKTMMAQYCSASHYSQQLKSLTQRHCTAAND